MKGGRRAGAKAHKFAVYVKALCERFDKEITRYCAELLTAMRATSIMKPVTLNNLRDSGIHFPDVPELQIPLDEVEGRPWLILENAFCLTWGNIRFPEMGFYHTATPP